MFRTSISCHFHSSFILLTVSVRLALAIHSSFILLAGAILGKAVHQGYVCVCVWNNNSKSEQFRLGQIVLPLPLLIEKRRRKCATLCSVVVVLMVVVVVAGCGGSRLWLRCILVVRIVV